MLLSDGGVAYRIYNLNFNSGFDTSVIPAINFSTIVNSPGIGYYWYKIEMYFYQVTGTINVNSVQLNYRSFTAQVVKE